MHTGIVVLVLLLALVGCTAGPEGAPPASPTSPAPDASPPETPASETPPTNEDTPAGRGDLRPVLTTVRSGEGAIGTLTFRSANGVPIGADAPLRLYLGDRRFEAPLRADPARFSESDSVVVDQATYRLSRKAYFTLVATPAAEVVVEVHDGTGYVAYPYTSGDLIE